MIDAHTTTVDRLRQFSTARTSLAVDRLAEAQRNDARTRGTFPADARVLDLVTGHEGVVLEQAASFATPGVRVLVQLDHGDVVARLASELLARPTPPTV